MDDVNLKISIYLGNYGIRHSLKGYEYIYSALQLGLNNPSADYLISDYYEKIAEKYNVNKASVEKDIRYLLRNSKINISNKEFIIRAIHDIGFLNTNDVFQKIKNNVVIEEPKYGSLESLLDKIVEIKNKKENISLIYFELTNLDTKYSYKIHQIFKELIRDNDYVINYDDSKYIIFIENTELIYVYIIAERIKNRIEHFQSENNLDLIVKCATKRYVDEDLFNFIFKSNTGMFETENE